MNSMRVFIQGLLLLASCVRMAAFSKPHPIAVIPSCSKSGTIQYLAVSSVEEIGVYLPPCYNPTANMLYPVLCLTTLIPYIESYFNSSSDRSQRVIAGGSLGSATAYILSFHHPDLFSSAGVFGNGLITGQESQTDTWLQVIPANLKPRVSLNSGEQDTYLLKQARALIPLLDKHKIPHTEIFSPGGHSAIYWLTNFPAYFHWLAEDYKE